MDTNWASTFTIVAWLLWKVRNDWCFNHIVPNVDDVVYRVRSHVEEYLWPAGSLITHGGHCIKSVHVGWTPPPPGWVKFNTDGSVKDRGKKAACGGVLRDDLGCWLLGFSLNIGSASVLMSELRGIATTLDIAWGGRCQTIMA
ncbi:Ribonuclease H-like superfamily [Sesbania bispinosa]|nr:Ribonuclease H-like superfamily [Sesbania bispinosa]